MRMALRMLLVLAAAAPFVSADVEFTSPAAGATVSGGSTINVQWKDSGTGPAVSSLQTYQLFLCAGGNDEASFIQLTALASQGDFSTGNSASGTVQTNLGGPDKNAYFLKIISAAPGGTVINYSDRFTLSGMTGTFPPNVEAGIKDVSGTNGPAAQNNMNNNAGTAAAGGGQPYAMQSGPTKYAPMQKQPGTKITAKTASAQYPTSAVSIAKTILPTPVQQTTITQSGTQTVSSQENPASPAPAPMDAMQKYLERWKD